MRGCGPLEEGGREGRVSENDDERERERVERERERGGGGRIEREDGSERIGRG